MRYVAFDLGASSGKLFAGAIENGKLRIEPVHSFENGVICLGEGMYWDFLHIYREFCNGLRKAEEKGYVDSVGVDSYNNDFSLVDAQGEMLIPMRSYRDPRTKKHWNAIFSVMDERSVYMASGNQIAPFNTLMQLAAMRLNGQGYLMENARHLLMLPDLIGYYVTGVPRIEYTVAAETELLNLETRQWIPEIFEAYDIPRHIMPEIAEPCTILGKSTAEFNAREHLRGFDFVNVSEHDTASAFLTSPYGKNAVFISSGTWSLVGLENDVPIVNDFTYASNIANEGGMKGHHRLLKNVMGSWLLQELRKDFAADGMRFDYAEIQRLAGEAPAFRFPVDPDEDTFFLPGNMRRKIAEVSLRNNGIAPETPGEFFRCVYEALAMKYRFSVEQLEQATNRHCEVVHIFGGGCQDAMLNACTANACGRSVAAGPVDASAIGNIIGQMIAHGEVASVEAGRELVQNSFEIRMFSPENSEEWNAHYPQYVHLFARNAGHT